MSDKKDNDTVPRKNTGLQIERDDNTYTATWKLPSNATSDQRSDRTEKQAIHWYGVRRDNTLVDLTKEIPLSVGTLKHTMRLGQTKPSGNLVSTRYDFFPATDKESKPVYEYKYVTDKWRLAHKDDKQYEFSKAKKANSEGFKWYYTVSDKKYFVSDAFYNAHKNDKKYSFKKVQELLNNLPEASKRTASEKTTASTYKAKIKEGKIWRAAYAKGIQSPDDHYLKAIRVKVWGGNDFG